MVRDLTSRVVGRTIVGVEAEFPGSVAWPDWEQFVHRATGRRITNISRRGKYAIFSLNSGGILIVHRGMTGSLLLRRPDEPMEGHVRVRFLLDNGEELRFNDSRKFGKILLMDAEGAERPFPWSRMGPEPLDEGFSRDALREALAGRTALIKPLLLNQQIVAGLGNIYVDEALFRAAIHPQRRANTLSDDEMDRLHEAIRAVLHAAVTGRGTTFNSYTDIEGREGQYQEALQVFHRTGEPCPRCGTPIERLVVGGRGTHICPNCQKA